MTRSELVALLHKKLPEKSEKEIERAVVHIFEHMLHALEKNRRIEIRNFGSFLIKKRDKRLATDPRNGKKIWVQNRYVPFFKPGKTLAHYLNEQRDKKTS